MKEAFEKAGLKKEDMAFHMHVLKYFESGGDYERGIAIYNQTAKKMGKMGHRLFVGTDHDPNANLPQPIPGEGLAYCVNQDQPTHADARSQTLSGDRASVVQQDHGPNVSAEHPLPEGHTSSAQQSRSPIANGQPKASGEATSNTPFKATIHAPPVRDPDDKFRQALTRDRIQNATIWLELNKTSDGRYWSKVRPAEFAGMERDARFVHHIKTVFGEFNQKQMNTELGKLMPGYLQEKLANRVKLMEDRRVG